MDSNTVATILAVVTAMGVPTGLLFRALQKSHEDTVAMLLDQIQDLQGRLDRALGVAEGQTEVNKELIRTTRTNQRQR